MSSSSARGVGTSYGAAGSGRDRAPDGPAALEELREETRKKAREVARAANREFINVGSIFNSSAKAYELKEGAEGYMPAEMFNAMKAAGAKPKEASAFYSEMKKRGAPAPT